MVLRLLKKDIIELVDFSTTGVTEAAESVGNGGTAKRKREDEKG